MCCATRLRPRRDVRRITEKLARCIDYHRPTIDSDGRSKRRLGDVWAQYLAYFRELQKSCRRALLHLSARGAKNGRLSVSLR